MKYLLAAFLLLGCEVAKEGEARFKPSKYFDREMNILCYEIEGVHALGLSCIDLELRKKSKLTEDVGKRNPG